ncbi:hypothetical protein LEP1GSC096_0633 [Leptospira interrogans serovar Hebdomadis str. R499]|uniref:Uncharacterized protein n=1 Tax=Leptospira interrogans serovar Zanoni str. LT2156 TaxID=1001601 RepID=M6HU62_LEPIR|nr:hypothetical protein LEP1GSC069_0391 [Leptospira interrogans serovar Canicola str. Fiocruz LV133]EKR16160.1 hypothetical protein LEP1GSC019_0034 [Leptospira interrogans serovar Pyrogenes str. 2006006960]EKR25296.1 hypothetical protein LEP1GSC087_0882 [Leptospira interrogans serovar Bataviae str. L1111]EKR35178.1 hypothetical protein LEP1GSC096_0633 [Leptospira interrogans serovar Hebdomadis str. R499]EMK16088.1 hypothetical protein LEP1GSC075_0250 [Leptospira interrogans str. Kito]EMM94451.
MGATINHQFTVKLCKLWELLGNTKRIIVHPIFAQNLRFAAIIKI